MPISTARHLDVRSLSTWLYHAAERKILEQLKAEVDARVAELGDLTPYTTKTEPAAEPDQPPVVTPIAIEPLSIPQQFQGQSFGVKLLREWISSVTLPADGEHQDEKALKASNIVSLLQLAATLSKLIPA